MFVLEVVLDVAHFVMGGFEVFAGWFCALFDSVEGCFTLAPNGAEKYEHSHKRAIGFVRILEFL